MAAKLVKPNEKRREMVSRIHQLEEIAQNLDPKVEQREEWTMKVIKHSQQFLATLDTTVSQAYRQSEAKGKGLYESPIEEQGTAIDDVLELFEANIEKCGLVESHGGHMAYINSGGIYPSALADYLTDVVNPYSAIFHDSPGSVRLENMIIKWIKNTFNYPETAAGNLSSGGSMSTILALAAARDSKNLKAKDFDRCVVYTTVISHFCVDKALNTIGMREAIRHTVTTDSSYRMDVTNLKTMVENDIEDGLIPFVIYSTAGTTDLGSVDQVDEIAKVAGEFKIWLHVDACYGGFFILAEETRDLFRGIEKSDSFAVDPHKGLFIPYGCGIVMVKNGSTLKYSNALKRPAFYLDDSFQDKCEEETSPCDVSFELSRHFRGMRIWMPLKLFGVQPFRAALSEKVMLARYFYDSLSDLDGFQLGPYPQLSAVIFRYVKCPNGKEKFNKKLLDALMADGRIALASTRIRGIYYLRICILCFRTHLKEVDLLLQLLPQHVDEMLKTVFVKPWDKQQDYVRG
ncbi:aromatic-L-amino-acid decarboxylase-like [Glandiceps talaboti]